MVPLKKKLYLPPVSKNCCTPIIRAEIQSAQAKSWVDILDDPLRKMKAQFLLQSIPPLGYRVLLILRSLQQQYATACYLYDLIYQYHGFGIFHPQVGL